MGNEHENPPQAVHHAGDRGQELDDAFEHCLQARGQEVLGQKNGNGNAKQPADDQRQE